MKKPAISQKALGLLEYLSEVLWWYIDLKKDFNLNTSKEDRNELAWVLNELLTVTKTTNKKFDKKEKTYVN